MVHHRRQIGCAGHTRQAGTLFQGGAVGAYVPPSGAAAEGRHGHHHQIRLDLDQIGIGQPEFGQHALGIILDHRIRPGHQAAQQVGAFRAGEVERDAGFVAVQHVEPHALFIQMRRHAVGRVIRAAPPIRVGAALHLDDLGAKIGQLAGGERPGPAHRQIDHPQARQRQAGADFRAEDAVPAAGTGG